MIASFTVSHFTDMDAWHWWILAVALLILEVALPGSFLLWMGMSAGIVGVLSYFIPGLTFALKILLFSVCSVVSVSLWKFYQRRHPAIGELPLLNRRLEQHQGKIFTLTVPTRDLKGRLKIEDTWWSIESDVELPAGSRIIIQEVRESILQVRQISPENLGSSSFPQK